MLKDSEDIRKKKGVFIGSFNKLLTNFGNMQLLIYCYSFYGSDLWKRDDGF